MPEKEECIPCRQILGITLAIEICERAKKAGLDCKKIEDNMKNNKMTLNEFFGTLKEGFSEDDQEYLMLKKIERITLKQS